MSISEELKKQLNESNYYTRLGLERNAEGSEIKAAYRKIALKVHPDKNNGDDSLFKKLGEAYEILNDDQKRAEYDSKSTESFEAKSNSMEETASSSAPTMITEDIDSLEKLNNFILKLEKNFSKISVLETEKQSELLKKIASKKKEIYLTNARRFNALDKTVKKILASVQEDMQTFLVKNKIHLIDPSLLDMDSNTSNPDVFFQKVISASEDIKKQIQDTFELLKSKTQNPKLIESYDACIKSDSITSMLQALNVTSENLENQYTDLLSSTYDGAQLRNKIQELEYNKELSSMDKIASICKKIDNLEDEKKLEQKYKSLESDPKYSPEFKHIIKLIYEKQNILPNERLKQIDDLQIKYKNQFIEENNVEAIYKLIKKYFPSFQESQYRVLELENEDKFSRAYGQIQKLKSFFPIICNYYLNTTPYSSDTKFIKKLSQLRWEKEEFKDKTITEKFDTLLRLVGEFETKYINEKVNGLENAHWGLFEKELEHSQNLTMKSFSKFYDEQTNKFITQLTKFLDQITGNNSFQKKHITDMSDFKFCLNEYKRDKSLDVLSNVIEKYNLLKEKFDLHIENENPKRSSVKTSTIPTPSSTPNQVHEKSTIEQHNNNNDLIKEQLLKYIARIDSNKNAEKKPDFAYGFWVFKESRAINRKINYLLAGKLLELLNERPGNFSIFEKIVKLRQNIVDQLTQEEKKHYADRGINSTELNKIIDTVKSFKK